MLKQSILSIMLAGAGVLGLAHVPASAAPIPVVQQGIMGETATNPLITEVKHFKNRRHRADRNWRWNRKRHGDRCRYRRAGCNHFFGGYHYRSPFWLSAPFIGGSVVIGGTGYRYGNRHVRWCMDRYRSYKPRYNTWVTYGGEVRQCISPYGP